MSMQAPDWVTAIPSTPGIHQQPPGSELTRPFTQQQLKEFGIQLLEQFIKRVLLGFFGSFTPGAGSAFEQLQEAAEDLRQKIEDIPGLGDLLENILGKEDGDLDDLGTLFLNIRKALPGLNILDGTFDPQAFWTGLIANRLRSPGLLVFQSDFDGDAGRYPPYPVPFTPPAPSTPASQFFTLFRQLLPQDFFNGIDGFNLDDAIKNFIAKLTTVDLLALLGPDGRLLESMIPKSLLDFLNGIAQMLGTVVSGNPLLSGLNAFLKLLGIGNTAQQTATTAVAATAAVDAVFVDYFDRSADANLSGALYTQRYRGSGSGFLGTDGAGATRTGGLNNAQMICIARRNAPMPNDRHVVKYVLETGFSTVIGIQPWVSVIGRCYAGNNTYVEGYAEDGVARIYVVNADNRTLIAQQTTASLGTPITVTPGDIWELFCGTGDTGEARYEYVLKRNNNEICRGTDSAHITQLGVDYRYPGFIVASGVNNGSPVEPPKVTTLSGANA